MFTKEEIKKFIVITGFITVGIIVYHLLDNFKSTLDFLQTLLKILSPITAGFIIAYIVNIPMKSVEKLLIPIKKLSPKLRRIFAFLITLIIGVILFTLIFSFAIPQLANSVKQLIEQLPEFAEGIGKYATEQFDRLNISDEIVIQIQKVWEGLIATVLELVSNIAGAIVAYASEFVSGIFNAILSTVMAVYILLSKESIMRTFRKVLYAFTPSKFNTPFVKYLKIMDNSFEHFIRGQLIEALVLGILCYIGMLIFRFEYALLISVLVGLTNIIPLFGPYIGAVPSVLLLLMVNPVSALWFILYVSILQQIEANLIYPRVVGSSMGLSGFWIIVAVVVGNSLFGIMGILIGIPLLSTAYIIVGEIADKRLKSKKINIS